MLPSTDHILSTLEHKLAMLNMRLADHPIDHICYRCVSDANYIMMKATLADYTTLIQESLMDGRQVSIWKMFSPLVWHSHTIPCVELCAPKPYNTHGEGREHIEVVVEDLDTFDAAFGKHITERKGYDLPVNRNLEIEFPHANSNGGQYAIKFHEQTIEEVIAYEKKLHNI